MRLACVKHAASVRSEPGSNSQVHPKTSLADASDIPKQTSQPPTHSTTPRHQTIAQGTNPKHPINALHQSINPEIRRTNIPNRQAHIRLGQNQTPNTHTHHNNPPTPNKVPEPRTNAQPNAANVSLPNPDANFNEQHACLSRRLAFNPGRTSRTKAEETS